MSPSLTTSTIAAHVRALTAKAQKHLSVLLLVLVPACFLVAGTAVAIASDEPAVPDARTTVLSAAVAPGTLDASWTTTEGAHVSFSHPAEWTVSTSDAGYLLTPPSAEGYVQVRVTPVADSFATRTELLEWTKTTAMRTDADRNFVRPLQPLVVDGRPVMRVHRASIQDSGDRERAVNMSVLLEDGSAVMIELVRTFSDHPENDAFVVHYQDTLTGLIASLQTT